MRKLFLFILLLFSFTTTFASEEFISPEAKSVCNDSLWGINFDTYLPFMTDFDRQKYVFCLTSYYLKKNTDSFETEEEIIESSPTTIVPGTRFKVSRSSFVASQIEKEILLKKQTVLAQDKKQLNSEERTALRELQAWIDCWWFINVTQQRYAQDLEGCMKDMRLYSSYLIHTQWKSSTWLEWYIWRPKLLNSFLSGMSDILLYSSFWYSSFDQLPNLPYTAETMFDTKTLPGIVNTFALAILGFLIVFYFFKKWTWKDEEDYKTFFIKLAFIFLFTLWFPKIYGWMQSLITLFESGLINSLSQLNTNQQFLQEAVEMRVFMDRGVIAFNGWLQLFGFIVNVILLAILSIFIFFRDFFVTFLWNIFFLTSIWLMIWVVKNKNIFEAWDNVSKWAKFLVNGMFFALWIFVSIIFSIFIFKFITVILAFTPSVFEENSSILDNLAKLWFDAFVYMVLIIATLYFWFMHLRKIAFDLVADFFKKVLFPETDLWNFKDFTRQMASGYQEIKIQKDMFLEKNPDIKDSIQQNKELVLQKTHSLQERFAPIAALTNQVTDRNALLNRWVRRVGNLIAPMWLGVSDSVAVTEVGQVLDNIKKSEKNIEILNEKLSEVSLEDDPLKYETIQKRIDKEKQRREQGIQDLYNTDVSKIQKLAFNDKTLKLVENLKYTDEQISDIVTDDNFQKIDDFVASKGDYEKELTLIDSSIDDISDRDVTSISERRLTVLSNISKIENLENNEEYIAAKMKLDALNKQRDEITQELEIEWERINNKFVVEIDDEEESNIITSKNDTNQVVLQKSLEKTPEPQEENLRQDIKTIPKNSGNIQEVQSIEIPKDTIDKRDEVSDFFACFERYEFNSNIWEFKENPIYKSLRKEQLLKTWSVDNLEQTLQEAYERMKKNGIME